VFFIDWNMEAERKTESNKKKLLEALEETLGIVTDACRKAKVSRSQYYEWLKTDSEFKAAVDDIQELQMDFVESMLLKNIKKGKEQSILFYLRTKGKKRGYSEEEDKAKSFHETFSGITMSIKRTHDGEPEPFMTTKFSS
jgi:hypothetical protein